MDVCKFTEFGLCVKTELLRRGKEQKWLEEKVTEMTGLYSDSGYMYKILTGQRAAPKLVKAICEILDIENPYSEAQTSCPGTDESGATV